MGHAMTSTARVELVESIKRILDAFAILINELAPLCVTRDLEHIRKEVYHGVYDDALENLIAIGLKHGSGFTIDQSERIEYLAMEIGLTESIWLDQLPGGRGGAARTIVSRSPSDPGRYELGRSGAPGARLVRQRHQSERLRER
jgi:hypothetical protein